MSGLWLWSRISGASGRAEGCEGDRCDISGGVLACAAAINSGRNIDYRQIAPHRAVPVADEAVDLGYSFAVIQHVVFKNILGELRRILKPEGIVVCVPRSSGYPEGLDARGCWAGGQDPERPPEVALWLAVPF